MARYHGKRGKLIIDGKEYNGTFDLDMDKLFPSESSLDALVLFALIDSLFAVSGIVEWVAYPLGHSLWCYYAERGEYVVGHN